MQRELSTTVAIRENINKHVHYINHSKKAAIQMLYE